MSTRLSSRTIAVSAALCVLAIPSVVSAAYTSTVSGSTATMTGNTAADTLSITQSGGLFRHNRVAAGDAGFNSDADFDSGAPGDQTVSSASGVITINAGNGNDTILFGDGVDLRGAVDGGSGRDTLQGPNAAVTWNVTARNQGVASGLVTAFTSIEVINGGAASDVFMAAAFDGGLNMEFGGGGGTDALNFDANQEVLRGDITPPSGSIEFGGASAVVFTQMEAVNITNPELPLITIDDVAVTEKGNQAVSAVFTVSLSYASAQTATVQFATEDGSANFLDDYDPRSGTLTFVPGDTTETIAVPLKPDSDPFEALLEAFFVNLLSPINARIADFQGRGTIVNNQRPTISTITFQAVAEDGTTGALAFTISDPETAPEGLTVSGTSGDTTLVPNSNIVFGGAGADRTITVTPAANQTGGVSITIRVSDGSVSRTMSFNLLVTPVNDQPAISAIADQTIDDGHSTGALPFTIGDVETAAASLTVSGSSSNPALVPVSNILFDGSGAGRTVTVVPAAGQAGVAVITITVSDGEASASTSFTLTVNAPAYSVAPTAYAYREFMGTSLNLSGDSGERITSPFPLHFGEGQFADLYIGSNGHVNFERVLPDYQNTSVPTGVNPTLIAPFWDHLYPFSATQNVFWTVQGTAPNRELVVEWRNIAHEDCQTAADATVTFQIVFFEESSRILFNYKDTVFGGACATRDHGGAATVAVQLTTSTGTLYSFDAPVLSDGLALLWTMPGPDAFGKSAPADDATDQLPTVLLEWNVASGTEAFEYCIDTSDNNVCDTAWIDVGVSLGATVTGLSPSTTYAWQVRARSVHGTTESDGGVWWTFTTTAFRAARLTYPSTNVPLPGTHASFAWDSGANITEYSLWIGFSPGSGEIYKANESGLTRVVQGLPIDGRLVYVRLWSRVISTWIYNDAVYLAASEEGDGVDPTIVPVPADYDGDGNADGATWFGGPGIWYIPESSTGAWRDVQWGRLDLGDRPVPGDYDGDGRADPAVWRADSGFWYVLQSSSGYDDALAVSWGRADLGDQPVPADYDGDGKIDPAVWRAGDGYWHILQSSTNYTASISIQWGAATQGDRPMPADYDGDGKADPAVWRTGAGFVYVLRSSTNYAQWVGIDVGALHQSDAPVFGDYDGDGEADAAFWIAVSGEWHIFQSSTSYADMILSWGREDLGDRPVPADYDGDGKTDPAVRRSGSGVWYYLKSSTGYESWGQIPE